MKRHERSIITQKADADINCLLVEKMEEYDLTYGEMIKIIGSFLSTCAKYMIRVERHPNDPDKPGDIE